MMPSAIEVLASDGAFVLRYWKFDDELYFGGTVHDWAHELMPFALGPHVWHTTNSLLKVIADIARMDAEPPYSLAGAAGGPYENIYIGRVMAADKIAHILGCDEKRVRDVYRVIVEIPEDPA